MKLPNHNIKGIVEQLIQKSQLKRLFSQVQGFLPMLKLNLLMFYKEQ